MSSVVVRVVMMRMTGMLMSFGMLVGMAVRFGWSGSQGYRGSNHALCYNVT